MNPGRDGLQLPQKHARARREQWRSADIDVHVLAVSLIAAAVPWLVTKD